MIDKGEKGKLVRNLDGRRKGEEKGGGNREDIDRRGIVSQYTEDR